MLRAIEDFGMRLVKWYAIGFVIGAAIALASCSSVGNPYTNRAQLRAPGTAYAAGNDVYH